MKINEGFLEIWRKSKCQESVTDRQTDTEVHKPNLYKNEWWSFVTEKNYPIHVGSQMTQKSVKWQEIEEKKYSRNFSKSQGEGE